MTLLLTALGTMGCFEFVREAVRKPFVIANYMFDNSLYATPSADDRGFSVEAIDKAGVLNTARWVRRADGPEGGREIFRVECQSCHTPNAYRGVRRLLTARQWEIGQVRAMLGSLDMMHNGVMPPFAGTDAERDLLAEYLATLYPPGSIPPDGQHLFEQNCSMCHQSKATDPAVTALLSMSADSASDNLKDLPALFVRMPDLKLSEQQRSTLVQWMRTRFAPPQRSALADQKGEN